MRDLVPGSGWGLVDCEGVPKVAYHHLRRALAPVAVWTTDEGLAGVAIHVANDRPEPLTARLRVALYRELEHQVDEVSEEVGVLAHGGLTRDVEGMLGRFVDASYAYRFGEPQHDLIVATLESRDDPPEPISQAVRFPSGRPTGTQSATELGLEATAVIDGDDMVLAVGSRRLAYCVRVHAPGFASTDDAFSVEPGGNRVVRLRARKATAEPSSITLTALNLEGSVEVDLYQGAG
jgi:beta-mannosidase